MVGRSFGQQMTLNVEFDLLEEVLIEAVYSFFFGRYVTLHVVAMLFIWCE